MKVFISFSSADKRTAEAIYSRLRSRGIDCWISSKDINPGEDYQDCIVKAINSSDIVLLVFSSSANKSVEILKELSLASKKTIIPARIEDVLPEGAFQFQLSNRQFFDLLKDFDANINILADKIISMDVSEKKYKKKWFVIKKKHKRIAMLLLITIAVGVLTYTLRHQISVFFQKLEVVTSNSTVPSRQAPSSPTQMLGIHHNQQSITPSSPADPAKLNNVLVLLNGSSEYIRVNEIKALKKKIPTGLTAKDASLLLSGSGAYRENALRLIDSKIAKGLGGTGISKILGSLSENNRSQGIKDLENAGVIKTELSASEAAAIINGSGAYRENSLSLISGNIKKGLGGKDIANILGSLSENDRSQGIKDLENSGVIKTELSASEAAAIINGSGAYRENSLSLISGNIKKGLGGQDIANILGSLSESDRCQGIKDLERSGVIKKGLNADEAQMIIKGTGAYQACAVKVINGNIE
ncbi:toll/interleukin-1 receptor domain-containing protein [Acidithiobacillus sp. 'AMD consortium']|uniref:toll/interleukin-1 receptor domain-containing protein n=1 Tax=Acidithiobacillus sp. 'AMD consortium' TaxID=2614801 RepID=UPI00178C551D|nr:toll/interleukin-1 receptor domain-containing protein [Acidithiobacillus sp. 'AMD consortium']